MEIIPKLAIKSQLTLGFLARGLRPARGTGSRSSSRARLLTFELAVFHEQVVIDQAPDFKLGNLPGRHCGEYFGLASRVKAEQRLDLLVLGF